MAYAILSTTNVYITSELQTDFEIIARANIDTISLIDSWYMQIFVSVVTFFSLAFHLTAWITCLKATSTYKHSMLYTLYFIIVFPLPLLRRLIFRCVE